MCFGALTLPSECGGVRLLHFLFRALHRLLHLWMHWEGRALVFLCIGLLFAAQPSEREFCIGLCPSVSLAFDAPWRSWAVCPSGLFCPSFASVLGISEMLFCDI